MNIDADDFTLLGLDKAFALDRARLDAAWKALQTQVHPDRFAAEGAASQRIAMPFRQGDAARCSTLEATSRGAIMRRIREVGSVSSK